MAPIGNHPTASTPAPAVEPVTSPARQRSFSGALIRLPFRLVMFGVWIWGGAALWFLPGSNPDVAFASLGVYLILSLFISLAAVGGWKSFGRLMLAALALTPLLLLQPSQERRWLPHYERAAEARFAGDTVKVFNVRNANWRTLTEADVRWEDRSYDLRTVKTVDFLVQPFTSWRGLAHTFVSFGFENGEHLAISVEARMEEGEEYSPVKGMLRHYELAYVIGDERDILGVRANLRTHPLYLFPAKVTPAGARALLESLLRRATGLAARPEFYHTLARSCTTSLLRHVNEQRTEKIRPHWKILFPGYADELAWKLGLVDFGGDLAAAREQFRVEKLEVSGRGGAEFSRAVRERDPVPVSTPAPAAK